MQIRLHRFLAVLSVFCIAGCATMPSSSTKSSKPFIIAVLPDTQMYSQKYPEIFIAQTEWLAKNKSAINLLCVLHEGDIVNRNVEEQWKNADAAMSILEKNNIPYCMTIGNHDYLSGSQKKIGNNMKRNPQNFNKYFGVERISKQKCYGGSFNGQAENSYYLFEAAGKKILILCLEFGSPDEVLEWANHIASENTDRQIIVVTHCYMNYDETRIGPGDHHNPHDYLQAANDGEDMWEKFVRKHNNIFLVLSGHIIGDGNGRLTSYSDGNTKVTQVLANYQMKENGGNGLMRLLKFVPKDDKIIVKTYSPVLKSYRNDPNDCFVVEDAGLFRKAAQ